MATKPNSLEHLSGGLVQKEKMGQEELYQFLKSKGKKEWWTARKIVNTSKMSDHAVSKALKKLRENYPDYIKFRTNKDNIYEYKIRK